MLTEEKNTLIMYNIGTYILCLEIFTSIAEYKNIALLYQKLLYYTIKSNKTKNKLDFFHNGTLNY